MRPVIFYRHPTMKQDELRTAVDAGFKCIAQRMYAEEGDLIVGRYSVVPYYNEVWVDVEIAKARLINTFRQHCYIADMQNWIEDLEPITPKTWFRPEDVPKTEHGPFVLKGETNSRKENWKTHMFAANHAAIYDVAWRLSTDGFLNGEDNAQDIYVRQYVPLVTYARGLNDLPVTKEFRFFVCRRKLLTGAYYWSSWADTCLDADPSWKEPTIDEVPQTFLQEIIDRIGDRAAFYAVDVGQDETGRWWVIEVNDGQMAGLSGNKPAILYRRLFEVLTS